MPNPRPTKRYWIGLLWQSILLCVLLGEIQASPSYASFSPLNAFIETIADGERQDISTSANNVVENNGIDSFARRVWNGNYSFLVFVAIWGFLTAALVIIAIDRHLKWRSQRQTLRQLHNRLVRSEKLASLGQLTAGIAHEINNPANYIHSNIYPLKEYVSAFKKTVEAIKAWKENMPPEMRQEYDAVYRETDMDYVLQDCDKLVKSFEDGSNRIAQIVTDLRQYSRGDQGVFIEFNLHDALDSTLNLLQHRFKSHITVHKNYGEMPPVVCSPGQINQVFMNLLSNAEQAIEGKGNIWIETRRAGGDVVITIRDDGVGIPPENLPKLFDPFFTTKPIGVGTGLGLSISRDIIEQHGGNLSAASEPGAGTSFVVSIPIQKKDRFSKKN
ncbi:MAG: ATP-binding protein [Candidatus Omnitrophota bacterium]